MHRKYGSSRLERHSARYHLKHSVLNPLVTIDIAPQVECTKFWLELWILANFFYFFLFASNSIFLFRISKISLILKFAVSSINFFSKSGHYDLRNWLNLFYTCAEIVIFLNREEQKFVFLKKYKNFSESLKIAKNTIFRSRLAGLILCMIILRSE